MTIKEIIKKIRDTDKSHNEDYGAFLCPFHKEKTPSFTVRAGRFHCFGCGKDGDLSEFMTLTVDQQIDELLATAKEDSLSEEDKESLMELLKIIAQREIKEEIKEKTKKPPKKYDDICITHKVFAERGGMIHLRSEDGCGNFMTTSFDPTSSIGHLNMAILWNQRALIDYSLQESFPPHEVARLWSIREF